MKTRAWITVTAVLLLAAGASLGLATAPGHGDQGPSTDAAAQAAATVEVKNFEFEDTSSGQPVTIIEAGETVEWTWTSGCHSVTQGARGGGPGAGPVGPSLFDTGVQCTSFDDQGNPETTFSYTFEDPGVYEYYCRPHMQMIGTVIVLPG